MRGIRDTTNIVSGTGADLGHHHLDVQQALPTTLNVHRVTSTTCVLAWP